MATTNSNNPTSSKKLGFREATAGAGSNPPTFRYDGMPVPWWFNPPTAKLFHNASLQDDDIIVSSGVKMGTTWFVKLLVSLLYEYDDDGNLIPQAVDDREKYPGRFGQTYPDGLYPNRAEKERDIYGMWKRMPGRTPDDLFGDFVWEDFLEQPRPRMFVSHLFGRGYLPRELFDDDDDDDVSNNKSDTDDTTNNAGKGRRKGKGRLIVVVRNLRDTLVSLHNFLGTSRDGWLGNEHGPGSFHRFLMLDDCPNAMGNAFHWVRENAKAVEAIGTERALVVHYESLVLNFGAQLKRINKFLGLPDVTEAKARAITEACSLKTMAASSCRTRVNCRKGKICGWKDASDLNDDDHWSVFDGIFNNVLAGVDMAEPMRFFMMRDVPGMPPLPLNDCDLDTDPREWPPYLLVMLKEGMIVPDQFFLNKDRPGPTTKFQHSLFSQTHVKFDDTNSDKCPRYHLFVSASCSLASSVCAARHLLKLENEISMDISDGQSGAGWVFLNGASCAPWKNQLGKDPFWLYEAYQLSDPLCTTQIHVPVLWDTVTEKIVSNDAWDILKLMADHSKRKGLAEWNDALGVIAKEGLFPKEMVSDIESMFSHLQNNLMIPTQTAGMEYLRNGNEESPLVLNSREKLFASLKELEGMLGQKRFLLGNNVTGVDVYLAMCFFKLEACDMDAFSLTKAEGYNGSMLTGDGYFNLKAYSREMYQLLKSTLHFECFRHDFRVAQAVEFTRQLCSFGSLSAKRSTFLDEDLPNLTDIVAILEMPAGDRPTKPFTQSAPRQEIAKYQGVSMPPFVLQDSCEIFRNLSLDASDIIVSSGVKMGTTWVTKILSSLLHDFDENGNTTDAYVNDSYPNKLGQTYPEAIPASRGVDQREIEQGRGKLREIVKKHFGDFTLQDLVSQPSPRLFSTHLFGEKMLPKTLFDNNVECIPNGALKSKGRGRLIVVVRNLKDTLVSLHHFNGVPKDDWLGNEHGPGSLSRFLMLDDCPNAFGNAFQWVKMSSEAVTAVGSERALVIYYEALKSNFDAQLRRINDFLGLPQLSKAKAQAICKECSSKKMKASIEIGARNPGGVRKATIRDWTNYLDDDNWEEFDRAFNKVLNGVELAEPFRFFQYKNIPGMPQLSLKDCDLNTDPRLWPPPLLVSLREGMVIPDPHSLMDTESNIAPTRFKSTIRPGHYLRLENTGNDGSPRFHLFVAGSCPLALSVAAVRTLLGLEKFISMDISDGTSGAGWVFLNGATCSPWNIQAGAFFLHEAYQLADPFCTTNISVPLLWDTKSEKIVSNDSWEIMQLLSDAASDLGLCSCPNDVLDVISKQGEKHNIPTLFPNNMANDIEQMFTSTVQPLYGNVVRSGFDYLSNGVIETQLVLEGRTKVFAILDKLEGLLGNRCYLMGNNLTGVDVRLAYCLLLLDVCYWDVFQMRNSKGYRGSILTGEVYPNLKAYMQVMYRHLKPCVYFESFRQLYRTGQAIEFTRQSYSCVADAGSETSDGVMVELPDLRNIVAALESA
ncbi:hypothetical protein ACHAXR_009556 [Thalassiosira sp. AJA248-18]